MTGDGDLAGKTPAAVTPAGPGVAPARGTDTQGHLGRQAGGSVRDGIGP